MAEAFEGIGKIRYVGSESTNALAFKHDNAQGAVEGKVGFAELRQYMLDRGDVDPNAPAASRCWRTS